MVAADAPRVTRVLVDRRVGDDRLAALAGKQGARSLVLPAGAIDGVRGSSGPGHRVVSRAADPWEARCVGYPRPTA